MKYETKGTTCYGHWVLGLVTSHRRKGVRVLAVKKFCVLCSFTRHKGYDLSRALVSAFCDITHKTGSTSCCGYLIQRLVILPTTQGDFLRTLGSVSCDLTRKRGYELLPSKSSASCVITHDISLVISHTRKRVRFVMGIEFCVLCYHTRGRGDDFLRALSCVSCDIPHETRSTISYGQWILQFVILPSQEVRFVTDIGFCFL